MSKVAICMADGCEEIEGLTVVDVLRRGGMDIDTVSISGDPYVTGSHNIAFCADKLISELNWADYDGIVLPGGIPGTPNLAASPAVTDALKLFDAEGKLIAAICAAPSVLGQIGLLEGRDATSYPGFAEKMLGCNYKTDAVVRDGNIITSRGMGTAIEFALAIVEYFSDHETAVALGDKFIYSYGA